MSDTMAETSLQLVSFTMAGELYGIETRFTRQVMEVPRIVPVPRIQPFILGIINLRGQLTSVIDLRRMFGLRELPRTSESRIIVVRSGDMSTGILVEQVLEILELPREQVEPPLASLPGIQKKFFMGQSILGQRLLILLDVERLLTSEEMQMYRTRTPERSA